MSVMPQPTQPESLDIQIGQWIRATRVAKGWSQETLARRVGLSFQQIQKYEHGSSRILASKLCEFATVLEVDISCFFQSMPEIIPEKNDNDANRVFGRDAWKVAAQFDRIENKETRKRILDLVASLAGPTA